MPSRKLNYNPDLKPFARALRKEGTKGEAILWKKVLRARQMEGYQFNRQYPVGEYIVDFVCRKLRLIIEIDGSSHLAKGPGDRERQDFLESIGYTVLRVTEAHVLYRIDDVIGDIFHTIKSIEEGKKDISF